MAKIEQLYLRISKESARVIKNRMRETGVSQAQAVRELIVEALPTLKQKVNAISKKEKTLCLLINAETKAQLRAISKSLNVSINDLVEVAVSDS